MKKKMLIKLSSILGCFGLCGAFALSSLLYHKQNTEQASAVTSNVLFTKNFSRNYQMVNVDNNITYTTNLSLSGYYNYIGNYGGSVVTYQLEFHFNSLIIEFVEDSYTSSNVLLGFEQVFLTDEYNDKTTQFQLNQISITYAVGYPSQPDEPSFILGFIPTFELIYNYVTEQYEPSNVFLLGQQFPLSYSPYLENSNTYVLINDSFDEQVLDYITGYNEGYSEGNSVGYATGYGEGYSQGNSEGYSTGYNQGVDDGKQEQLEADQVLFGEYYQNGYTAGYQAGSNEDATVTSIFGGIATVAMVPVNFFLSIFNFEILGVNIAAVVSALLSICIIIIVWRTVMGGKGND